jgi:ribosomal protein S18 acetylase RimI-like enzyme
LGRIVIDWFVHSAFPRRNLGRELLKYAFRRGRELGAEWAHICVPEEDKFSRDFLEELDFRRVRCFVDLELNLTKDLTTAGPFHLDELSHFRPGDEALLATTQNKIFSGSWGFCPNSPEEIRYFFLLTNSKWPDILFLKETSNIVGYFWPHPVQMPGHIVQKNRWRIHMFGINPEYQGKGWGKKIFASGLNDLKKKGAVLTEISVDSENTPALALYRSFGFKLKARDFWYEKLI